MDQMKTEKRNVRSGPLSQCLDQIMSPFFLEGHRHCHALVVVLPSTPPRQALGPEAGICLQGREKVSSEWPFCRGHFFLWHDKVTGRGEKRNRKKCLTNAIRFISATQLRMILHSQTTQQHSVYMASIVQHFAMLTPCLQPSCHGDDHSRQIF